MCVTQLIFLIMMFSANTVTEKGKSGEVPCIDDDKFYRNPKAPSHSVWSPAECAKYFLCLGNYKSHKKKENPFNYRLSFVIIKVCFYLELKLRKMIFFACVFICFNSIDKYI